MVYQPRVYRNNAASPDLVSFTVSVEETDLYVQADCRLTKQALAAARAARAQIKRHLRRYPDFASSQHPLPAIDDCSEIVARMYWASQCAGTGPMAAVAGAVAQYVGERLLADSRQVIVENGGDIFISTEARRTVAIEAGKSPLSGHLGLIIPPESTLGVCTSSGTVGHSQSAGWADAAVVVAEDAALADAVATELGNRVAGPDDCEAAVVWAAALEEVIGAVAICGETMAAGGEIELQSLVAGTKLNK